LELLLEHKKIQFKNTGRTGLISKKTCNYIHPIKKGGIKNFIELIDNY